MEKIIYYAKQNKKPVIFVTDDEKEDWWLIRKGKKISPRPELIREFYNETEQLFWMYTSERFMDTIKSILEIPNEEALEKAIEEMKETKRNENIYSDTQSLFEAKYCKKLLEQAQKQELDQIKQFQDLMRQSSKGLLTEFLLRRLQSQQLDWSKQIQDLMTQYPKELLEQQRQQLNWRKQLKTPAEPEVTDNETKEDH